MTEHNQAASDALQQFILQTFSEITEYPVDALSVSSHLENDLGIDSIALADIATTLTKQLQLAAPLATDKVETIADIMSAIQLTTYQLPSATSAVPPVSESHWLDDMICQVFANNSGYPAESLNMNAQIENDLGIDSINVLSIQSELLTMLGLDPKLTLPKVDTLAAMKTALIAQLPQNGEGYQPPVIAKTEAATPSEEDPYAHLAMSSEADRKQVGDPRTMRDFVGIQHPDLFHKAREFRKFYHEKRDNQLYWYGMPLETPCKNRAVIFDETTGKSREFLMFGSNSYLGLSSHPEVIQAIQDAAGLYGATNTGCRIIAGSNMLHLELERKLAKLKGRDDCIVYPSGYSANLGCISALTSKHDLVFTDSINHMSIQDGCKLAGAQRKIYDHSLTSLEKSLAKYADHPGGKLIVTDGVFSMHGDIVDLPRLVKLAERYGAKVLVDDAHSTGVLGKTGSGTSEHFNMKGQVDLELGTMSKSLSGLGGYVCADGDVVEYLRFYSNSYVFAATIPAHVAAGVIASIDIMLREPERLTRLWDNIYYFRTRLLNAGFDLENSDSAIIPVVVGDDAKTLLFGRAVRKRGMYCQTVVFPGVSVGDARLRISVTSEHTRQDLDEAYQILVDSALEVGVPVADTARVREKVAIAEA
ncbi:aminotransferase class I/II-fold pyridoxal phosphate-dependent enzyme [Vibrio gazogenes]|uniref:Glycine C-acetyltransferase n=1 Tax=Vibrio gazogenes DSM 21264 = NBRC 103151 TaxID=1123492 RepID=A0A1M4ZKH0_VIBGA|nr:aminotransferase class I/II-fold pyridoxal phosphate-dependent enzyme [Vibrio gazogenes]USP15188.1 aminotransferase class I/II-fold pyridoxal phosphate-dependent enzyme [Vibrio gazogenes]SHF18491.1 glycine C-acetyltransferase [Vibrio gazogenes DSM 21264] [Vibrio gazogenes DSM 21264 = NBRC 103151]SJN54144.1 8-amino-7-oxononanoate synthase [Vibrio gazogenes]